MKPIVPERDVELLSSYLDNQLSLAEKARLEKRLAAEPALNETLAGLRATVQAMRSLPPARVPRNFTLDPRTYGARQPSRSLFGGLSFGFMRVATGIAMFLFIFSVAGDFILRSGTLASPASQVVEAPSTASLLMAEESQGVADTGIAEAVTATQSPAIREAPGTEIAPGVPPGAGGGQGGGSGGGGGDPELESGEPAATPESAFLTAETAQPASDVYNEATQTAEESARSGLADETAAPESTSKTGVTEEAPVEVAEAVTPEEAPAPAQPETVQTTQPLDWLRLAQVVFGAAALALGLATLWYRSRSA